jgi:hypothetical protein
MRQESKGSISVFLSPSIVERTRGEGESLSPQISVPPHDREERYALTAYHVLPFEAVGESHVITPGGLGLLSRLHVAVHSRHHDHDAIVELLRRWNEPCGCVKYGHIGTTKSGWRSDFALVHLDKESIGENGLWYDRDELTDLFISIEKDQSQFLGARGIVGNEDPQAGEICYKDGAATGCTAGIIGSSKALVFLRRTVDMLKKEPLLPLIKPNSSHSIHSTRTIYVHQETQDLALLYLFSRRMAGGGLGN